MTTTTKNEDAVLTSIEADNHDLSAIASDTGKTEKSIRMTWNSLIKKDMIEVIDDQAFTKGNTMTDQETKETISEAMDETIATDALDQATDTTPPKKKARKKKTEETPETETEEEPTKPEPVQFRGYEVKDGADLSAMEEDEKAASDAFAALSDKEKTGLDEYLTIGGFQYRTRARFKSNKVFGQYLAEHLPASQDLDPALRSNATWLYGAVNDSAHEAFDDLLVILDLDTTKNDRTEALREYKSANPTVIKRAYSKTKKQQEKAEEAKAAGYEAEDEAEAIKAKDEADKAAEKERMERVIAAFADQYGSSKAKKEQLAQALTQLAAKKSDGIDYMESMLSA